MPDLDLDAIKAHLDQATPAPWEARTVQSKAAFGAGVYDVHQVLPDNLAIAGARADAVLIACLRNAAPALVAVAEAAEPLSHDDTCPESVALRAALDALLRERAR